MALAYQVSVKYGASQPNTVVVHADTTEFQQFEDLARKLLKVPKADLDKKRNKT